MHVPEENLLAWARRTPTCMETYLKCHDSWIIIGEWHIREQLYLSVDIHEGKPGDGFPFQF